MQHFQFNLTIIEEPRYLEFESGFKVLSMICEDENNEIIELVAYMSMAFAYRNYFVKKQSYQIQKSSLIPNIKYRRTQNEYKIKIDEDSHVCKLGNKIYRRNGKLFVKIKSNVSTKSAQLSILNYMK